MLSMDRYAHSSKLASKNVYQKMVFSLLTLGICLWADQMVLSLGIIFIMAGGVVLRGGTPANVFWGYMKVPLTFLLLGVLTILIGIGDRKEVFQYAFRLGPYYVGLSENGLYEALRLFLKAMGAVSCLYYLSLTTPMVDLMEALQTLRLPKLFIELMMLIYRFIFVLLEISGRIYVAQKARLGYDGFKASFKSLGALAANLFILAFKRGDDIYRALESRGYEGQIRVLREKPKRDVRGWMVLFMVQGILIFIGILLKKMEGCFNWPM